MLVPNAIWGIFISFDLPSHSRGFPKGGANHFDSCLKVNSFNLITEDFIAASLKSMRTDSDVDADAGADADTEGMRMGNGNATEPKVLGSHFVGGPQDLLGNH